MLPPRDAPIVAASAAVAEEVVEMFMVCSANVPFMSEVLLVLLVFSIAGANLGHSVSSFAFLDTPQPTKQTQLQTPTFTSPSLTVSSMVVGGTKKVT